MQSQSNILTSIKIMLMEDSKFEVAGHVKILNYKNMFTLGYVPHWCKENFVIKMLKILCGRHIY